ncbi:transcription-repair coupling factor [Dorea formicigenerans]|uniref:transcription-repair coupling factor n=1 Tax=Dorea formicigenerans TaxID=39486 RepID=UPI0032C1B664
MQALLKPLLELAEYEDIVKKKKEAPGVLMLTGCVNSQKTHMMYALSDGCCYKVIACSSEAKAKQIYEEYRFLDAAISFYPAKDLLFYQADIRSKELISQRMQVIQAVLKGEPITVVASFDAFMDALLPKEMIKSRVIKICSDETLNLDELSVKLAQCGYDREIEVAGPGQFAVRGGILDVYPLTEELPVRIELWGDEVDSIRTFDPETQRSIEKLDEVEVFPATEFPEEEEKRVSFLDYFEKENTILFLDEPVRLKEKGEGVEEEFLEAQKRRAQSGYEVADSEAVLFTTQEIMRKMNEYSSVGFQALDMRCPGLNIRASYNLQTKNVDPYNRSFELLTQDLKKMKRNQSRVILLSGSRTRARRLAEDLRDYNLSSFYSEDMEREVEPGEIMTAYGYIAEGYEYSLLNFVVISETDIFGKNKRKKKRRTTYEGRKIQSFSELKPGDYVVHENHGLGIYQGIEKIEVDKISKDYMKISYAKGGNLYIPATQLDLIQKYAGSDSKKPKLNRLGTQEWTKTKAKVRGAVKEIAKDLVELYAARQNQDGFVYGEDTVWQKEFEEMFPYEETEDQLLAINAVKKDMESHKIMDRLICGDVGYGKTEIAIRAAFKAVQENKQVVYLVPTTILAQQHYNTFCQRMKDFPVRVDLMCRFRTPAQQRDTIQNLKRGLVDIVVGTHRVLSDDIEYKDLGLLIIDEEQRFGVQHKEKIKKLKKNVDVLTLTATPIPRTLHMSLIGIRDMSVLEEAPQDRLPIQTYVMEYNDEMVREAIERECARNGQVYYVYNRVEDIAEVTAHIQKLVPELNVSFAHGQMKEHELEKIMYDFINGDIDVLVSTTIIETGLDISNVNTMIIHDADRLGLSQLYQLRGRVGRSGRMAYAFLLYRKDKLLKEIAEKRLAAIREFTDLGSGFKIAMRDLEIRGAGNLLGAEQHGHMEAVGYDMYCKMLNEAVKHLKGELSEEDTFTTALDVNVDAYIPDSYIPNEYHKLDIYKRIAAIESEEEMDDMIEELIDRFGDIPKKVELLLEVARLKNLAHQAYVTEVTQKGVTYTFRMYEKAKIHVERIPDLLKQFPEALSFKADVSDPKFIYQKKKKTKRGEVENPIEVVKKVLIGIKGLLD